MEGTIFALQLPEDSFMFGKVIARKHHLPMIDEEFFVVFISGKVSQEMTDYPQEFTEDNILLGPWLVSEAFWRNGTFYTVGFEELTDIEKRIDYGFYKTRYVVPKFGKQYNDMPKCFKNIFTLDEKGNSYSIRDPEEVEQSWKVFWGRDGEMI